MYTVNNQLIGSILFQSRKIIPGFVEINNQTYCITEGDTTVTILLHKSHNFLICNKEPGKVWGFNNIFPFEILIRACLLMHEHVNNQKLRRRYKKIALILDNGQQDMGLAFYTTLKEFKSLSV